MEKAERIESKWEPEARPFEDGRPARENYEVTESGS